MTHFGKSYGQPVEVDETQVKKKHRIHGTGIFADMNG